MARYRIGIALCTYNGAAYVREQLDSYQGQTRLPDSLVVVDDRSSDDTVEIVRAFAAQAPFPVEIIVNERNLGYVKNFEKAIIHCAGDIIALSDQDDVWYPEKLQVIEETFLAHPSVGAVFTDAEVVDAQLRPFGYRLWETIDFTRAKQMRVRDGKAFAQLLRRNVVTGATMAFKREFVASVVPIPTNWVHDGWIALLIACQGQIFPIAEPLIQYRQHAKNQIGARQRTVAEKLAIARMKKREYYQAEVSRSVELAQRLVELYGESDSRPAQVQRKIAHSRARAALPEPRVSRVLPIVLELGCLRYSRYSNGITSAIRDFVV